MSSKVLSDYTKLCPHDLKIQDNFYSLSGYHVNFSWREANNCLSPYPRWSLRDIPKYSFTKVQLVETRKFIVLMTEHRSGVIYRGMRYGLPPNSSITTKLYSIMQEYLLEGASLT